MKLSLGRASALALSFGLVALVGVAACADSEPQGDPDPSLDGGGDAPIPNDPPDSGGVLDARPDVKVDAGPKLCSDHGFCPTKLPGDQTVNALWGDGAGVVWAGTEEGDLLRWDGTAWSVHASGMGPIRAIWGSGPTDVWVGGEDGIQHGTANAAVISFAPVTLPAGAPPIASIWGTSKDDLWAVGSMMDPDTFETVGRALHFTGDGAGGGTWALDPISSNGARFSHVWGSASSGVWLGGPRGIVDMTWVTELVILHRAPGSASFVETVLPVDPDPDIREWEKEHQITGTLLASDTSITIYAQPLSIYYKPAIWHGTSADNGKTFTFTWARETRPAAPAVNAAFAAAPNDVWAAGEYGRLIHWNGTKWSTTAISVTGLPVTDPFLTVWARGTSEVWVGGKKMLLRYDPSQEKNGGVE